MRDTGALAGSSAASLLGLALNAGRAAALDTLTLTTCR